MEATIIYYAVLTPTQASHKISLLSKFITRKWGDKSPTLYETIDQPLLEEYERFITPYIINDLPVPEWEEKQNPTLAPATDGSKLCKSCHQQKPLSEFYSRPQSKDGKHHSCKDCMKARARGTQPIASKSS